MNDRKWKKVFFLLLGINILIILSMLVLVNLPAEDEEYIVSDVKSDDYVPFNVKTNKQDLNQIINHYLDKEGLTGAIDYKVILNEDVELYGTIPVFSQDVQMKLSFEPKALENGDIVLQQKSISIGRLQLPVSYVLKFVGDRYQLPQGVTIQPNEERIYVSLKKMKFKSGYQVKVDEFDLMQDDIRFTLLVPIK